jgi:hypothetical protein
VGLSRLNFMAIALPVALDIAVIAIQNFPQDHLQGQGMALIDRADAGEILPGQGIPWLKAIAAKKLGL